MGVGRGSTSPSEVLIKVLGVEQMRAGMDNGLDGANCAVQKMFHHSACLNCLKYLQEPSAVAEDEM